jgi:glucose-6-phosphate dehydrogenase assembly protein OpcA
MIQAPVTRQEAHEVPLGKIEEELARLWRESDAATLAAGGQISARNSVMTLVVFTHSLDQARHVAKVIEGLTGQHPSRSIILALQPDTKGPAITASVSIHSHTPKHGVGQVRAEQIMLEVRGNVTQHLPGVVLPLLLPEMPAFVWWAGELPKGDFVDTINDACDRAIVDSAEFANPERDLVRLADHIEAEVQMHGYRTAFSDFNWTRIKPWRELTAQFFDIARYRPFLDGIERIEIEYAVDDTNTPNAFESYLFAGWMASRLKWQTYTGMHLANGSSRLGLRTHIGAPVTIEMTPRAGIASRDWWATSSAEWPAELGEGPFQEGVPEDVQTNMHNGHISSAQYVSPGAIMRISLQARVSGRTATFTIRREDDLKSATTIVVTDNDPMQQRNTPLESYGETALLHNQLGIFERNHIYENAMLSAKMMAVSDGHRSGRTK